MTTVVTSVYAAKLAARIRVRYGVDSVQASLLLREHATLLLWDNKSACPVPVYPGIQKGTAIRVRDLVRYCAIFAE